MAKLRIVLKKCCRKQSSKKIDYISAQESCPPETPYQLFCNAAMDAVTEEFGAFMGDMSDEVNEVIFNAAVCAADAALQAAHVSNDWRDITKPKDTIKPKKRSTRDECYSCQPRPTDKYRPLWEEQSSCSATELYRFMAWQAQEEKFPSFMCDECGSFTDDQITEILKVVDYMLDFALTAAGVANDWTRLFEAAKAKMDSKK